MDLPNNFNQTQTRYCYNCEFWMGNRQDQNGQGECRRFPPQPAGIIQQRNLAGQTGQAVMSAFGTSQAVGWCGEFKPYIQVFPTGVQ